MDSDDAIAEPEAQAAERDEIERRFDRLEAEIAKGAQENEKLKASNASLRAEVDALRPKPAPVRQPIEPIVRITYPAAASSFGMPSDDELSRAQGCVRPLSAIG
jgi:hypothetical protein